jgi:hypothetical protein
MKMNIVNKARENIMIPVTVQEISTDMMNEAIIMTKIMTAADMITTEEVEHQHRHNHQGIVHRHLKGAPVVTGRRQENGLEGASHPDIERIMIF